MISIFSFQKLLVSRPYVRRILLILFDLILLPLSAWITLSVSFAYSSIYSAGTHYPWVIAATVYFGIPLYLVTGQYTSLTRYVGSFAFYRLACRNVLIVFLIFLWGYIFSYSTLPFIFWPLLWLFISFFTGLIRLLMRDVLIAVYASRYPATNRVVIYGAGEAGAQLAAALRLAGSHNILAFLDDDPSLWNRNINGIPIYAPHKLLSFSASVDQVFLSIPTLSRSRRRELVDHLQKDGFSVLRIPSVDDLASGIARIDDLRPVVIEDLLGRDLVLPDPSLLGPGITNSVVCITGAGGSIGSEIASQVIKLSPSLLVLLDNSEPALYAIEQKLDIISNSNIPFISVLGSACDESLLVHIFNSHHVDIVFHAAAYKHVPLVQLNPLAGLANNVFSTLSVCKAASSTSVREVLLISTDKAVRPTNVMGATKRLAELVIQSFAIHNKTNVSSCDKPTLYAMVRFGNVLGSSGSVVPLFRQQIAAGGPITLTHPEIIRYFMTIPEAAQLVLQASSIATGGDVFLLDMGEPVRIKDLAHQMVRLSGLTVRDSSNLDGDIDIVCTGLRPGEKLYEELLIDSESDSTVHPLIFRAQEHALTPDELWPQLQVLESFISDFDVQGSLDVLSSLVPEWKHNRVNSQP